MFFANKTLFIPGCLIRAKFKKIEGNYLQILKSLDIDFITMNDFCCGALIAEQGYEDETIKKDGLKLLKDNAVKRVITPCPLCFKHLLGFFEVEHTSQIIFDYINHFEKKTNERITYLEPCNLKLEEPIKILDRLGFDVIRVNDCCGFISSFRDKITKNVLESVKTEKLITTCPYCYLNLKEAIEKDRTFRNIKVLELSEVLV